MSKDRIRVLHVVQHASLGGATLMAMTLAERLDPQRYDVTLAVGREAGPEGDLTGEMRERGLQVTTLAHLGRPLRPWQDMLAAWELSRLIASMRPTIVHTHGSKPKLLVPLATQVTQTPITVAHIWGWEWQPATNFAARYAFMAESRLVAEPYDALISCSRAMRDEGLHRGVGTPEQYEVIYPSIKHERFRPPSDAERAEARAELGLPQDVTVVGSVMRLAPQKDPMLLLHAAALVEVLMPGVHWVIVGGGPLEQRVRRRVQQIGLAERVVLTGPRRDVPRVLAACDLFALSSAWEPFGIVYLEAQAMGLPVVGTDVNGASEAVADGKTGLLVPPGEYASLAAAIMRIAGDPDLAARMGAAGIEHARQFTEQRFAGEVAALYDRLLGEHGADVQR